MKHLACLLLMALAAQAAGAQTIYRCGADGRSYSDTPCPGGRAVAVADERSAQDRQAAERVAARDRALARRLRDDRLAAEREQRATVGSGLGSLGAPAPQAPALTPRKKPGKKAPKAAPWLQPAAAGTSPATALSTRPPRG